MSNIHFQTMAGKLHQASDCRVLYFEIEFNDVALDVLIEAGKAYYSGIESFFEEQFVSRWNVNDKSATGKNIFDKISKSDGMLSIIVEANRRTGTIQRKCDLAAFQRQLLFDLTIPKNPRCSLDFMRYYQKTVKPAVMSSAELKNAILQLFAEENKRNIGYYHIFDANGLFYALCENPDNLYHGTVSFEIGIGCISESLSHAGRVLTDILLSLCRILKDANGRVGLCPWPKPGRFRNAYMKYFGWDYWQDALLRETIPQPENGMNDQAKYEYLCGYDWANVLSKHMKESLCSKPHQSFDPNILETKSTETGGLFLRLNIEIERTDVAEMACLKRLLYPVLFPGGSIFTTRIQDAYHSAGFLPRAGWELCPIDEDEIIIDGNVAIIRRSQV